MPEVSSAGGVSGAGGAGEAAGVSRVRILGEAGAGIWGSASTIFDFGTGACGAWRESYGASVYGGPVGRFFICGSLPGGICESGDVEGTRRWAGAEECVCG